VEWRLVEPLPLHVQEVATLQRDSANTANFIGSDRTGKRDLSGHGSTADDWRLQVELLHHGCDTPDVGILVVCVAARIVALVLRAIKVRDGPEECCHAEITGKDLP